MKKILFFLLFIASNWISGQTQNTQDSVAVSEVIHEIESNTSYHFYYHQHWIDSVFVPKIAQENQQLSDYLTQILKNTTLSFYIDKNQVFLLNNAIIITKPAILQLLDPHATEFVEEEVTFLQENATVDNLENQLMKIGNRKRYQQGDDVTLAGYITEQGTGKPASGINIFIRNPLVGTSTNLEGFFSLTIPSGRHDLFIESVNMKNTRRRIMLYSDGRLDVSLASEVMELESVTINAERDENISSVSMGVAKINLENLKVMPAILGEKDIIKVSTTTAGVQFLGEGAAGINVRGGKADQNLFLLDGSTIYNANHFFGFFSIFNAASLSGMDLYKSAIPAEYGGRLSAIFDVQTKRPNAEKFSATGGISPVTSNLMLETPIVKGKTSVMLGGRATYSDYVLKQIKNSPLKNNQARFYDIFAKIQHQIDQKDDLSVTAYYSFDGFQLSSDTLLSYTNFEYTNQLLSFNWKHIFNEKLQTTLQAGLSNYTYEIGYDVLQSQAFHINYFVKERHVTAKVDYMPNEKLNYKFGTQFKYFQINPGVKAPTESSLVAGETIITEQSHEIAPYFSVLYTPNDKFSIESGVRYSIFSAFGEGLVNAYDPNLPRSENSIISTTTYGKGEKIQTYHGAEIRLSSRYSLNQTSSLKASYNRTRQNIHLLSNSVSVGPTDMWRISNAHIKPQIGDQFSLGYYKNTQGNKPFEASAELYYKKIQSLLDFKVGADLIFNRAVETDILQGNGKSYGLELSAKKSSGWFTGWLNYTYSRSFIQLDGNFAEEVINRGEFFPTGYDKPHYLNAVTNYKFTRRLTMSMNVVYATGVPTTYPTGKWIYKNSESIAYSDRNAYRIPDYFRMDVGINLDGTHKIKKLAQSFWSLSVYNVLGRDNIYSIFFRVEDGAVNGYRMKVFATPIPTLTYNFTF